MHESKADTPGNVFSNIRVCGEGAKISLPRLRDGKKRAKFRIPQTKLQKVECIIFGKHHHVCLHKARSVAARWRVVVARATTQPEFVGCFVDSRRR